MWLLLYIKHGGMVARAATIDIQSNNLRFPLDEGVDWGLRDDICPFPP